jgi:hypothetical protein
MQRTSKYESGEWMDYNLSGSIAADVNFARPIIEYVFLFLITLITAGAGIAGVYVGQRNTLKLESEKIAKANEKEKEERRRQTCYKFIEIFTTPFQTSKNDGLKPFDYIEVALGLNEFGNLILKESLNIQYINKNDKIQEIDINSLEDLIQFIIVLRSEGTGNQQSRERFENLYDEVRFKAANALIPLINDMLRDPPI